MNPTPVKVKKYSKKKPLKLERKYESENIRILAFSDWRVQELRDISKFVGTIDPVDIIVYAGDDLNRFQVDEFNYLSYLSQYTNCEYVLSVLGNDDFYGRSKKMLRSSGVHDLYNQSCSLDDFLIIGLESSTKGPAIFRHDEKDFQTHLTFQSKYLQGKKRIIVSHTPPYKILDRGIRFASTDEETHYIGSKALRNFLVKNDTELVICGHCHSHGGLSEKFQNTTVVNVSSHDSYGAHGNFALIELNSDGLVSIDWYSTKDLIGFDSLRRIHGVGPSRFSKLLKSGIKNIENLAELDNISKVSYTSGFSEQHLHKLQLQAKSVLSSKTYQIAPFNFSQENVIYFDIETDINRKRVWLIGILIDNRFTQLFAENWGQENRILYEFIEILKQHPDRILVSYSCINFDYDVSLAALERHNLDIAFFQSYPHQDLGTLLRRCFIFPNQSFALKELGTYLEYPFKYPDMGGFYVALNYMNHVEQESPLDPKIFEYNEDDVRVIPYLIDQADSLSRVVEKHFELTDSQSKIVGRSMLKVTPEYNLAALYPEIANEWDASKNVDLSPFNVTPGSSKKVWWICPLGHSYESSIYGRKSGKGCPYCSGRYPSLENNLEANNPDIAQEWHPTRNVLKPSRVTSGSGRRVWWQCSLGHEWKEPIWYRTINKYPCPYCVPRKRGRKNVT